MFYLCCVQPVLYLSLAALSATPFGVGLLLQLFNPGVSAPCLGMEGFQLPGERVLDLGFLQRVLSQLQDRPPLLLCVFYCLLSLSSRALFQVVSVTETLALSPQLCQLGVSHRLGAQDGLRIKNNKLSLYFIRLLLNSEVTKHLTNKRNLQIIIFIIV